MVPHHKMELPQNGYTGGGPPPSLLAAQLSSLTESENLGTAAGICRPKLPVPIYNRALVVSQNCEMQDCQWYEIKQIKSYFCE